MHLKPTKTAKWFIQWDKQVKFGDAALMYGCVHSVQSCSFISNGAAVEQLDCMRFEGFGAMTLKNVCFWDVTQYIYDFI
jgi:hypothetical protein